MDWLLLSWAYWAAAIGAPAALPPPPARRDGADTAGPTAVDRWLIEVTYEVAATATWCEACGAPLYGQVRLTACPAARGRGWRMRVDARCRGWRRHRHVAVVDEACRDLRLGRLHRTDRVGGRWGRRARRDRFAP
jgi:hypothetical protein